MYSTHWHSHTNGAWSQVCVMLPVVEKCNNDGSIFLGVVKNVKVYVSGAEKTIVVGPLVSLNKINA